MKERPECIVKGCSNPGWVFFGGQWVCGECMAKFDRVSKANSIRQMQEVLENADSDLQKM